MARDWGDRLQKLQAADPEGYPHRCTIYEGLGHWMDGRDAEVPWMAVHPRPVAHQSGLAPVRPNPRPLRVAVDRIAEGQQRHPSPPRWMAKRFASPKTLIPYTLRLSDALVDLDGRSRSWSMAPFLQGQVHRTEAAIRQSLSERFDPASVATALVDLPY